MIGYLSGAAVKQLIAEGVTQVWYGVSTTPQYRGDLVSVYFLGEDDVELAHQTQLSGQLGSPEVAMLTRRWGPASYRGYERAYRWNAFVADEVMLVDHHFYRVV